VTDPLAVVVASLPGEDGFVEVVERKGFGHPDTICDALAQNLSDDLCQAYRDRFGVILHHNVDKALLCAGRSAPAFGGGRMLEPIDIYLAGRATADMGGVTVPLGEIAVDGATRWLKQNLRALDAERDVRIHPLLRPGSGELRGLFDKDGAVAGDTSIGVGYAPLSDLERLVIVLDRRIEELRATDIGETWGEDTKIMAMRRGREVELTIACAMIDRFLRSPDEYFAQKSALSDVARGEARAFGFEVRRVEVNAADRPELGQLYLTVTGTSAESGDDGQVGRGNRLNGLITPGRPMSLEAVSGKNPITHVGKVYNDACHDVAHALVAELAQVARAECLMVSRIGRPIAEPALVEVKVATYHPNHAAALHKPIEEVVRRVLAELAEGRRTSADSRSPVS
jgi:S-adenosylmethionine synthetase